MVERETKILRTVYLSKSLDNDWRDAAFRASMTKGEYLNALLQRETAKEKRAFVRAMKDLKRPAVVEPVRRVLVKRKRRPKTPSKFEPLDFPR